MNVLVTGAGGFVGRALVARLLEDEPSYRLTALLLPSEDEPADWNGRVRVVRGDLRDPSLISTIVADRDLVFHLAAFISYWRLDRPVMEAVNRDAVTVLVDACIDAGVRRLVHISSVGAVGFRKDGSPAPESEPFNWPEDFAYMTTKRDGQRIVLDAVRTRGLDAVVVNPASIMGPGDPSPESAHNRLYRDMYRRSFFFGTFAGGLAIVDVRDLVSAILAAAKTGRSGETYLAVGANVPYSRVLELMARAAGKVFVPFPIPPLLLGAAGWIMELASVATRRRPLLTVAYGRLSGWTAYYSNEKCRSELGVSFRPLEQTIGDASSWYRETFINAKAAAIPGEAERVDQPDS